MPPGRAPPSPADADDAQIVGAARLAERDAGNVSFRRMVDVRHDSADLGEDIVVTIRPVQEQLDMLRGDQLFVPLTRQGRFDAFAVMHFAMSAADMIFRASSTSFAAS